MDPTVCLTEILLGLDNAVLSDDEQARAMEQMEALLHWLRRGGFLPDVPAALVRFQEVTQ